MQFKLEGIFECWFEVKKTVAAESKKRICIVADNLDIDPISIYECWVYFRGSSTVLLALIA